WDVCHNLQGALSPDDCATFARYVGDSGPGNEYQLPNDSSVVLPAVSSSQQTSYYSSAGGITAFNIVTGVANWTTPVIGTPVAALADGGLAVRAAHSDPSGTSILGADGSLIASGLGTSATVQGTLTFTPVISAGDTWLSAMPSEVGGVSGVGGLIE